MNPWVAGRIVEQMQIEARRNAVNEHLVRPSAPEPRRERVGLAVAGIGLRIAGRRADQVTLRRRFPAPARSPHLEASR